jgi:hypothetical protein
VIREVCGCDLLSEDFPWECLQYFVSTLSDCSCSLLPCHETSLTGDRGLSLALLLCLPRSFPSFHPSFHP